MQSSLPTLVQTLFLAWTFSTGIVAAQAAPTPVNAIPSYQKDWNTVSVRIDVKNLTGPAEEGRLTDADMSTLLDSVNRIWSQCSIRFLPRVTANVSAANLKIPYIPKSQSDLSAIAAALNPNGFKDAIPFTVAGPWRFYDAGSGLYLNGLGWAFANEKGVDRIGAMVSSLKLKDESAGGIAAHEIGHAVSLPDSATPESLMGPGGTNRITENECHQSRLFIETALKAYIVAL